MEWWQDPPSRSEAERDALLDEVDRAFFVFCAANNVDPESTEAAVQYELLYRQIVEPTETDSFSD